MLTEKDRAINEKIDKIMLPTLFCVIALSLCYSGYHIILSGNVFRLCYFLLYIIGLVFSCLLFSRIYGFLTKITSIFCGDKARRNDCGSVIASQGAFIIGEVSWSDIGVIYFASMLAISIVFPFDKNNLAYIISSLLTFPCVIYSIYYQWRVIRGWCTMCLIVQLILLLQIVLAIYLVISNMEGYHLTDFFSICLVVFTTTSVFFVIKKLLKDSVLYKSVSIRYHNFKFDNLKGNLFISEPLEPIMNETIVFNEKAIDRIGVVFRFGCTPCMYHMDKIIETIESRQDIGIEFIFNSSRKHLNEELPLMLYFASLYKQGSGLFLIELKKYANAYPASKKKYAFLWGNPTNIPDKVKTTVTTHIAWCAENNIKKTPTFLLNNRTINSHYDFKDLTEIIGQEE